jgi:dienelactone hydrolase
MLLRSLLGSAALLIVGHASANEATAERGRIASIRDCDVSYRVHRPVSAGGAPVAIIAHGFLRDGSFMAGWGDAFASAGIAAVTVDLCASSATDGRHGDNGADLVALRRALALRNVVYVGVSAGGLAALVAASRDPDGTRGVLLLDPVNAGGQARSAAGRVHAPVAALVAKAQVCNAWRNIDPALETLADATIVRIERASHCDFEWPTDRFCRVACLATNDAEERDHAQRRIRRLGIGFVQAVAEGTTAALARWRGDIAASDVPPFATLVDFADTKTP